ncbi:MAG: chromosomal replication initiator protein DnaA [Chloroflexi bacterium]|nr:chromosomal replication initiator protein DnaA [Chloroflexota bacterium]MCI0785586.1 chromosomal replication initiator protein DnaA [Chloroflexota bacterium]MCI0794908.1 chromosomal replication initiator protein DnaA [Chloroflexota bacterium]MCI0858196.1 chromosomal replication initiator protein DnaA [Chloroflexota bacterium]MCI0865330.1 chromosomal replication initiator protein DnaA [Chloroflexota bacterium]
MTELSTRDAWRAVLGELQLQMPRSAFETWLRQTEGVSYDDQYFIVEAPTPFAVAWLERRMYQAIQKTVEKVVHRPLEVQFQVRGGESISSVRATNPADQLLEADAPPTGRAYETQYDPPSFNPRYTFDSFVVGSCNELAFSTAQVVADSPGQCYNPLFLYSGVGLGKTHLLHAIGHTCASNGLSVRYVTSEQFTNEFISSISKRTTEEFRNKYRSLDVLLLDDVQFMSGKEQTHESFFHTFNDLHNSGHQVVITSDRPPNSLALLEDRLRSRFHWGLIADMQPPGLETRMAILASKAKHLNIQLDEMVVELIAKRVQKNVRELEGSLNRMVAQSQMTNAAITMESASRILDVMTADTARHAVDPQRILDAVSGHYKLTNDDLLGRRRTRRIAQARQVAMYLLIYELELSPTQVGRFLGGRDHATVIYGAGKINGEINEDSYLRQDVLNIKEAIFT